MSSWALSSLRSDKEPLLDEKSSADVAVDLEAPATRWPESTSRQQEGSRRRTDRRKGLLWRICAGAFWTLLALGIVHAVRDAFTEAPAPHSNAALEPMLAMPTHGALKPVTHEEIEQPGATLVAEPLATTVFEVPAKVPSPTFTSTSKAPTSTSVALAPTATAQPDVSTLFADLDREACGSTSCQFLVIGFVGEQETKAELHIGQIALLASRSNRTLVLPRSNHGRYQVCSKHPFDAYHDIPSLEQMFDVRAITWEQFEAYAQRRTELGYALSARYLQVEREKHVRRLFRTRLTLQPKTSLEAMPEPPVSLTCLNTSRFDMPEPASYRFATRRDPKSHSNAERYAIGDEIHDIVTSSSQLGSISTIFVHWKLASRVYASPSGEYRDRQQPDLLRMNEDIRQVADEHAAALAPFVVVQWRMERVSLPNDGTPDYVACAKDAIKQIERLEGVNSVYLATDFPMQGYSHPHSDTFVTFMKSSKRIREAAVAGIEAFLAGFSNTTLTRSPLKKRATGLYLTSQHAQRPSIQFSDTDGPVVLEDYDAGMTGVFDKLMAERAAYYFVGEPQRCSRFSTFSGQIVLERAKRQREGDETIISPVEYFGEHSSRAPRYPLSIDGST